MALRSLQNRLQKLEARKPEVSGLDSVENSATYEFTDWTCEIGRIQREGNRPQDWLELIQSVEEGQFTTDRAQQLYVSNLCADALKSIPEREKKTLQYANLLIHCASLRGQQSVDDAREMFQDARYDAKKFAIVHIAAAQFELSLGNRDKAKKILDRAKSLHAEPLSLVTKAFSNLVYGHPKLLDQAELDAQEKENKAPVEKCDYIGNLLTAKQSKDGGSGYTFSRDLTNIAHLQRKETFNKTEALLARPSRDGSNRGTHHMTQAPSNGISDVSINNSNKEALKTGSGGMFVDPVAPVRMSRTHRLSESSDDSSNLTQKHGTFKPPLYPNVSCRKFKTPLSEQKPTLATTEQERPAGLDDSLILFNFKRERNISGNTSDDADSVPVSKDSNHGNYSNLQAPGEIAASVISSSCKKLRSYHSTPDCKKSGFLSMPSGSSTGHLFSRKRMNIGKPQRVPKRTSLPQVTEGGGNSDEDEDSLKMNPLPAYWPPTTGSKQTTEIPERFGSIDSDSGIFGGIENLTKDILTFVEESNKKVELNEPKVIISETSNSGHSSNASNDSNHLVKSQNGQSDLEPLSQEEYNISHDSVGTEKLDSNRCYGDSGYKSQETSDGVLEPKPSYRPQNRSVLDASQGTLLGTAEFCPQSGTLVGNEGVRKSEIEVEKLSMVGDNRETETGGNRVEVVGEKSTLPGHQDGVRNVAQGTSASAAAVAASHGSQAVSGIHTVMDKQSSENKHTSSLRYNFSCGQPPVMSSLPQQQFQGNPGSTAPAPVSMMQQQMMMAQMQCQNNNKLLCIKGKCYTIIRQMGSGGSSKVYEVQDQDFDRLAVKCVSLDGADDLTIESYRNEIELLDRLQYSKAIIKLYDYEYKESDNTLYVVLEKGERDLANFFRSRIKDGNMSPELLSFYWKEMLRAVQVLHKEGIVHSDLKPANFLMVCGELKLIDFGIAKAIQPDMTSVTRENQVGTLNYMSPEAILDSCGDMQTDEHGRIKPKFKIGVKSDVWSLGCILHFLAYRKTPFQHINNPMMKLNAITNPSVEIVLQPHKNGQIVDVIKKCLQRDPKQRPSIEELLETPLLLTKA